MMSEVNEDCFADLVKHSENCEEDEGTISDAEWKSARLSSSDSTNISFDETFRLQQLEEEQERLNNSLFSLSSHFAQVQFRLKQIAESEGDNREKLLQDLQDFAFRGVADMEELNRLRSESDGEVFEKQKDRQNELLQKLRDQLEDLEKIAYENGEGELPSTVILQKQKAVLDKLHEKIQLNLQMDKMSPSELQKQVDDAIRQFVNPFKEKQQLVEQLQTQIIDLERFVNFLQAEQDVSNLQNIKAISSTNHADHRPKSSSALFGLIGCSTNRFQKNQLKHSKKENHYGDERAHLQLAVDETLQVLEKYTLLNIDDNNQSQEDKELVMMNDEVFERSEEEIVSIVRKKLCPTLKALLEHGMLKQTTTTISIPGFGCFTNRSKELNTHNKPQPLNHIWDVILYFYESKNGRELSDAPVRKLSQSFRLDNVAGRSITSKQVLLTTIENIMSTHTKLRRSKDSQWKAFVSAALNEKKLPAWIRIIFRTRQVVESCYSSWSYVARTGCEELYTLLECIHKYNVQMPVDLALRPFEQMKEAF